MWSFVWFYWILCLNLCRIQTVSDILCINLWISCICVPASRLWLDLDSPGLTCCTNPVSQLRHGAIFVMQLSCVTVSLPLLAGTDIEFILNMVIEGAVTSLGISFLQPLKTKLPPTGCRSLWSNNCKVCVWTVCFSSAANGITFIPPQPFSVQTNQHSQWVLVGVVVWARLLSLPIVSDSASLKAYHKRLTAAHQPLKHPWSAAELLNNH